tara:strand:+ start:413 stop:1384 length:972 start_codon:yes stop_codon:yes gene_type:complete
MNELKLNTSIEDLTVFLNSYNLLNQMEKINKISKAGQGNMNLVLRIKTNKRSFILKQSRPYAEKYPSIKAPIERINTEYSFYKTLRDNGIVKNIPKIITFQKNDFFMLLEDIGESDFSDIYSEGYVDDNIVNTLIGILKNIHSCKNIYNYPLNKELKELNHQHIFILPFEKDNGFDLNSTQQGLMDLAKEFTEDKTLKNKVLLIGKRYLNTGKTLLHGDFYPGSWMKNNKQIYIIDPEFSFVGDIEFDYAILAAHLILITSNIRLLELLLEKHINQKIINLKLFYNYTGVEIIRRLIGIAQLPLNSTIEQKRKLLYFSKSLIT